MKTFDITPKGLETPEGVSRTNAAIKRQENAISQVAQHAETIGRFLKIEYFREEFAKMLGEAEAWDAKEADETYNVPKTIEKAVEIAKLSEPVRALLLEYDGGDYPHMFSGSFNSNLMFSRGSFYGTVQIIVDKDDSDVTPEDIDAAILAASKELELKRQQKEKEEEEKKARAIKSAAMWAALPLSERATARGVCFCRNDGQMSTFGTTVYDKNDIMRYAKEAYEEAEREYTRLRTLEDYKETKQKLKILAEFLAAIPQDALRGTLKAVAHDGTAIDELRKKIEDASPFCIFEDE